MELKLNPWKIHNSENIYIKIYIYKKKLMEKLIKEEINRIREVMGLKLLKESIVPTGVIKSLLSDFATVVGKNLDDITQMTNIGTRRTSVAGLYNSLKNSTDQSVKNFVDAVDEVASFYKRDVVALLDDISTGKVADEIQDEIFTKLASKTTGVDAKLVDLLPDDIASYYKQVSNSYTRFENNLDGLINAYEKDPTALQKAIDKNVEIRNAIVNLPDGPFKQKLLNDWDNQLKFFDDNIVKKIKGGADEASSLADEEVSRIIDEIAPIVDETVEETEQTLYSKNSPIFKFIKKTYPGMNDVNLMKITESVGAKIIEASKLVGKNDALVKAAEEVWGSALMTTARKEELIEKAIKISNPKVNPTELQYWKNWWLGRDAASGKSLSFGQRYKKFVQANAVLLALNLVYKNWDNLQNVQWDDLEGDNAAAKVWNILGMPGSLLKALAPLQLGFVGTLIYDGIRTTVEPEFDQLYEVMGPGGYGWYKNIGDVEKFEDTSTPVKNSYKIVLKTPVDGKSDLGSWTYDSDAKKLLPTRAGEFEVPQAGTSTQTQQQQQQQQQQQPTRDDLIKWLEDNAKNSSDPWDYSTLTNVTDPKDNKAIATVGGKTYGLTYDGTTWKWD
jgi:hypothetical protein